MSFDGDRFGPPYRAPCGGWPSPRPIYPLGSLEHYNPADNGIPFRENITMVADYLPADDSCFATAGRHYSASGIPPYPRLAPSPPGCGSGACPACPSCGPADGCEVPPCGAWDPWSPGVVLTPNQVDFNAYDLPGTTIDYAVCRKIGFKNVQAKKVHHGRLGFLDNADDQGCTVALGSPCDCNFQAEQFTFPDTRYLKQTTTVNYSSPRFYDCGCTSAVSASATRSVTVNRLSGERILETCEDSCTLGAPRFGASSDCSGTGSNPALDYIDLDFICEWDIFHVPIDTRDMSGVGVLREATVTNTTITWRRRDYAMERMCDDDGNLISDDYSLLCVLDVQVSVVLDTDAIYSGGQLNTDWNALMATWSLGDDRVYPWRHDGYLTVAPLVTRREVRSPATPNPYPNCTMDDYRHGIADNAMPPNAPYSVGWNPTYSQTAWKDPNCWRFVWNPGQGLGNHDAADLIMFNDGTIKGAPNPAGSSRHFDWEHETWKHCVDGLGNPIWYIYSYGAWSGQSNSDETDAVMPLCATQWTNNFDAVDISGPFAAGNWKDFGKIGSGTYRAGVMSGQKHVECQVVRPSQNFARPCGVDRFLFDHGEASPGSSGLYVGGSTHDFDADAPDTVRCIKAVTGDGSEGDPYIVELISGGTGINTGEVVMTCGVTASGVWIATRVDDTHFKLAPKKLGEAQPQEGCGSGIFGRLKWWYKPGICGRAKVASASASMGTTTVVLEAPGAPYARTGDIVDFTNADGTIADSGYRITVIDATHFTYTGPVSAGIYVKDITSLRYWWDDDNPKGNYIWAEWQMNFRDYQERDRVIAQHTGPCHNCADAAPADSTVIRPNQEGHGMPRYVSNFGILNPCLVRRPCCPSVIGASPNAESFPNGAIFSFPELIPDWRYGSRWQGAVVQHLADLYWHPPSKPCVNCPETETDPGGVRQTLCPWLEDPGICKASLCTSDCEPDPENPGGAKYYAHRPYVEALAGVPTIGTETPPLPDGVEMGFLSLAQLNLTTPPDGNVLPPPGSPGSTLDGGVSPTVTPWTIYLAELTCVCGGGETADFLLNYIANGVNC